MASVALGANQAVWAFLVVSDPGQADTLEDQAAWTREAARANGWTITRTVSGVSSGKVGARKLALHMLDDIAAMAPSDRPGRLLMIRLERLGRGNGLEAIEVFLRLRHLNVVVHTRLDGDVSYDRASELLMPVLRFFIGGMENEVRRDKLNATYARKRKAKEMDSSVAVSNRPPYGLCIRDGHLLPQPPEDAAVRLAYQLKAEGYGNHVIAKRLANIAPPKITSNGEAQPQTWRADRVRKLIINGSYRGTLVDEEIWLRAQRPAREVNRPTRRYEYSFGGALQCVCGLSLVGVKGTGKPNSTFRYYQCKNFQVHGRLKHYRSDVLEQQFIAILKRLAADEELVDRHASTQTIENASIAETQLDAVDAELRTMDARRRQVHKAFEDGALAQRDLQWRLDDLRQEQNNLEERHAGLERELMDFRALRSSRTDIRNLINSASSLWCDARVDDRRALARAIGKAFGGLIVSGNGELWLGVELDAGPEGPVLERIAQALAPMADLEREIFADLPRIQIGGTKAAIYRNRSNEAASRQIWTSLKAFLRRRSRGARLVEDLGFDFGDDRSSRHVVRIARDLHGYIILPDLVDLDKLLSESAIYSAALDRVTLVAPLEGRDLKDVNIPPWWGILEAGRKRGRGHFKNRRAAARKQTPDIPAFLGLFSREDVRRLLVDRRIGHRSDSSADELYALALATIPFSSIHAWGIRALTERVTTTSRGEED